MAGDSNFSRRTAAFVARCAVVLSLFSATAAVTSAQSITHVPSATRSAGIGAPGFNNDFGIATNVSLNAPSYSVFDAADNLYISDSANNCIRKVDKAGNISTVAGLVQSGLGDTCNAALNSKPTAAQGLLAPAGLAIDTLGNLYIADTGHNCVRRLPAGQSGTASLTAAVDTCNAATPALSIIPSPIGVALDATNRIYVATNNTTLGLYQVVRATSQTTACSVAGVPSPAVLLPCPGINGNVILNQPNGLSFDTAGNLFIADTGNACVRELNAATETYSTPVGRCANDGTGNAAFAAGTPNGITFDQEGRLLISSTSSSQVYQVVVGNAPRLVAGLPTGASGTYARSQDGAPAVSVPLSSPEGLSVDSVGNVYVSDTGNAIVRELNFGNQFPDTPVGSVSPANNVYFQINSNVNLSVNSPLDFTLLHSCGGAYTPNPPPVTCLDVVRFAPTRPGVRKSALIFTDSLTGQKTAFRLEGTGTGSAILFLPGQINTNVFNLANPVAVTEDTAGNRYYLQQGSGPGQGVLYELPFGQNTPQVLIPAGGGLDVPTAVSLDAAGNIYVADKGLGEILEYDVNGKLSPLVTGLTTPNSLVVDVFGNIYVTEGGATHALLEIQPGGEQHVVAGQGSTQAPNGIAASAAAFLDPTAIAIDVNRVLYVGDSGAHRVYSIDTARLIHLAAGNGTTSDTATGTALGTGLKGNLALAVDPAADLYIADSGANQIKVVYASPLQNGAINVVGGNGTAGFTGDGKAAPLGQINDPNSLTVDDSGNLFFVDAGNNALREITYAPPSIDFGTIASGQTSAPMIATLWDVGTDALSEIPPLVFSDPAHFSSDSGTTNCGLTILSGSVCNLGFVFKPSGAGAYTSTVAYQNNSYSSTQTITLIGKATPPPTATIVAPPTTVVYGQTETVKATVTGSGPTPTGTLMFTYQGAVVCPATSVPPSGVVFCTITNPPHAPVGSYTGQVVYSGDSNYAAVSVPATLNVTPAPLTVTASSASRPYGTANPAFTAAISGLVNNDTATASASTTATVSSPAGTYAVVPSIVATGVSSLSNYTVTLVNGTLTITKATTPLVITVNNASRPYGAPNPVFTGTVTGALNGDNVTVAYSTTATSASPVGAYPITAILTGASAANYSAVVVNGTLTVTPAALPLVIRVNNATRAYGAANPTFTGTVSGLLNGDNVIITYSTTATAASPVGAYPITATASGASAANYTVTVVNGTLTVTPAAAPLIKVNNATRTYGTPNPTFSGTVTGALNGDTITVAYSTVATVASPAGPYPITATLTGASAANYAATVVNGTLTVTPAATVTTLSSSATSAMVGSPLTFTAKVTSPVGLVPPGSVTFSDGATVLATVPLTSAGIAVYTTSTLAAGMHTITASYVSSTNFSGSTSSAINVTLVAPVGTIGLAVTPNQQLIQGGSSAVYQVTVSSLQGFAGPVTLSCSGLPQDATCTFATPTGTLTAGGSFQTTMTTTATSADAKLLLPILPGGRGDLSAVVASAVFPLELTSFAALFGLRRRKSIPQNASDQKPAGKGRSLWIVVACAALLGLAGCGCPNTTFHTYPITVTATSVNGGPAPSTAVVYLSVSR